MAGGVLLLGVPVALLALAALAGDDQGAAALAAGPYGAAVVAAARTSLGVKETAPNDGPEIAAWAAELGLLPPLQWCGVAVSHWLRQASKATGLPLVVPGAGRAKALLTQFQQAGRALTAEQARGRTLPPGTVLVWDMAKVAGGPEGHTGIVEVDRGAGGWTTIEGNTPHNDVRRVQRPRSDVRLLGAGLVDGKAAGAPTQPGGATGPAPGLPPKRVLVAGDSLAVGLAPALASALAPAASVQGFGANGTTIAQWTNATTGPGATMIAGLQPLDRVLVSLGTNDIAAGVAPDAAASKARELVALLETRGALVGWIMPPELPWPGWGLRAALAQALAADLVPAFDSTFAKFERAPDGVHATPAGYAQWAQAIAVWAKAAGLV